MRAETWCGASISLTDHLATIIHLDLSRSRWFALASVEQVARCSGLMATSAQASARGRICMADRSAAGLGCQFVGAVSIGCHSGITFTSDLLVCFCANLRISASLMCLCGGLRIRGIRYNTVLG